MVCHHSASSGDVRLCQRDLPAQLMDKEGYEPAFPFGFGPSYTTPKYGRLQLNQTEVAADGTLRISVEITNTGQRAGDEVARLYVGNEGAQVDRPVKELKGFARVHLELSIHTHQIVLICILRSRMRRDGQENCMPGQPSVSPHNRNDHTGL